MGALLAWAIHWHWRGGLVASVLIAAFDLLPRSEVDQGNYGNVFLILIGGPIVGYMCESLQRMARERDAAERAAAAAEERTRLARAVHDGVLQVLAMTQRRGAAAGGEWAELGRLAGEQEREPALADPAAGHRAGDCRRPGGPGRGARGDGHRAPRTRRGRHARRCGARRRARRRPRPSPPCAPASTTCWRTPARTPARGCSPRRVPTRSRSRCATTAPASTPGRLRQAAAEGRLGVASSIAGRIEELGGTATVQSG